MPDIRLPISVHRFSKSALSGLITLITLSDLSALCGPTTLITLSDLSALSGLITLITLSDLSALSDQLITQSKKFPYL